MSSPIEKIKNALRSMSGRSPRNPAEFDVEILPRLLGKPDPVILEIGCNDGTDTRQFLRLFERPTVFAFEPDARALANFRNNVQDPRVTLFELAIGDTDGSAEFHVSDGIPSEEWVKLRPRGWDFSGSLKKPKEHLVVHPWCKFDRSIVVETKRLDTWAAEEGVQVVDFLWADVQGAEENVIRGGPNTFRSTRYFYTEYSERELYEGQLGIDGIKRLLPDFEIVEIFPNDVLLKNMTLK